MASKTEIVCLQPPIKPVSCISIVYICLNWISCGASSFEGKPQSPNWNKIDGQKLCLFELKKYIFF